MDSKRPLPDAAKKHFESTVDTGRKLLASIDSATQFYKKAIQLDPKYDDLHSLSTEIELLQDAKVDIRASIKRASAFLRYPSKYWKLPEQERDEDSPDFDPDAVMDEILQYANMDQHQKIIDSINNDIDRPVTPRRNQSMENDDPSVVASIGRVVGRMLSLFRRW